MSETEDKLARELGVTIHVNKNGEVFAASNDALALTRTFRKCLELTEQCERGHDLYQHYKGDIYRKIADARSSENRSEELVVYQSCKTKSIWVRPKAMFEEILPDGTPRFRKVELTDKLEQAMLDAELTEQRGVISAKEFVKAKFPNVPEVLFIAQPSGKRLYLWDVAEAYASSRLAAWRCFFCDEIFTDEAEAKEHFGSDEYELCAPPGCIDPLRTDEKARLKELHQAEAHAMKMQQEAEENDEAKGLLETSRSEIGRYFGIVGGVTASTPHQAWLVLEAEQGKVIAAESRLAEVTAQLAKVEDLLRRGLLAMNGRARIAWADEVRAELAKKNQGDSR
jgi:hypothetical protein